MLEIAKVTLNFFLVLHFVGLAALLGGYLLQLRAIRQKTAEILPGMIHGALTMFVTGLALVGIRQWELSLGGGSALDNGKIAIKTVVVLIVLVLVLVNRKKKPVSGSTLGTIGGLTFLNVVLAVFW
jgi:predicted membrane protein